MIGRAARTPATGAAQDAAENAATAETPGQAAGAAGPPEAEAGPPDAQDARSRRGPSPWRTAFFGLAAAGLIGVLAWVLLGSRLLVVRSVGVTGTHLVPAAQVLAAADVPTGEPLMRVSTGGVASRVERIPQVQSATVSRAWPDRLVITVVERKPALAIPAGSGYDLVDQTGVILQNVRQRPTGLPRFIPVGALPGNPGLRAAASVVRSLPSNVTRRVKSVTAPTADSVTLYLAGGVTVDWGSSGLTAQKDRVLTILLRTHAHYYDVSAPGTAVTG
ncbi:MAG TPA: FtsQ-type POTRA domain-containing protein [Streptosporangiaceae bacterium]